MLTPNNKGDLYRWGSTDLYGEPSFAAVENVDCAVVRLVMATDPTSIRTDKSASRSSADETVAENTKILFPASVAPSMGDKFVIYGFTYKIKSAEPRISVAGKLDHYECKLESWLS